MSESNENQNQANKNEIPEDDQIDPNLTTIIGISIKSFSEK